MRKEILRLERVTVKNREKTLLQDFELNIFESEMLGLVPVNAYGIPNLIEILLDNQPLYDGYVYYRGKLVNSWKDVKHTPNRIGLIAARSSLVNGQNAVYNIFVLRPGFRQIVLQPKLYRQQLELFMEEIEIDIPLEVPVERLSTMQRVVVELIRAVVANQRLIVLHEVTTFLSDAEVEKLLRIVELYSQKGFSFLYITPHFEEVPAICQRVAIMKNGHIIKTIQRQNLEENIAVLYPKDYKVKMHFRESDTFSGMNQKVIFEAKNIQGEYINNLNFYVRKGEYLVIHSTDNWMYQELVSMLCGDAKALEGTFCLHRQTVPLLADRRIAVIYENPADTMLFYEMSYMDNLCLTIDQRVPEIWRKTKITRNIRQEYGKWLGEDTFDKNIADLTEMEKCKLVYARIMLQRPEIVFCIQPFKGVDLAHRKHIWKLHEMLLEQGAAIVMVTLNVADELSVADRVIQLSD